MRTRITSPRAQLLGAALAAALAIPCAAAGQQDSASAPPPSPQQAPPPTPQETPTGGPAGGNVGAVGGGQTSGQPATDAAGGARAGRQTDAPRAGGEARARPRGAARTSAGGGAAASGAAATSTDTPSLAAPESAAALLMASADTGASVSPATADSVSRAGEGGRAWLVGAAAAFVLLLAGQGAIVLLLRRIWADMRDSGTSSGSKDRGMNDPVHLTHQHSAPVPGPHMVPAPAPAPEPEPVPTPDPVPIPEPIPTPDPPPAPVIVPGLEEAAALRLRTSRVRGGVRQRLPRRAARRRDSIRDSNRDSGPVAGPEWPGGSHALYERARARLAELQGERGEKDRARLAAAAARFERRKAWVLALHEAWENEVDYAYLDLLQKPGVGAVKDPYVMVYPLSEHDWQATREELRRLAGHIDALPEEGHPQWPALLPRTALRSSVDFDLRVQPPRGTPPAAEFHARRLLSTLLVNLKTLQRARVELGLLVQWVVEAAPAAEARPADVSPQVLAVLDAVCAAGLPDEERAAQVEAALTALEAVDDGNFAAVRAAEDGAEKLEQRYRAFLKMLFRVVDGTDRARALHAEAMADGAAGDPWLAGWGTILDELDDLLVRRLLGGRLQIEPIACEPGHALDTDVHNPLGAEPVQGVERDQVWRVESRGFAYAEDGARRVVRPVDVIVAVPA